MLTSLLLNLQEEASSEEEVQPKPKAKPARTSTGAAPKPAAVVVGGKSLRAKTRNQGKEVDESQQQKFKEHQKTLHAAIQQRGIKKFKNAGDGKAGQQAKVFRKFESYKREENLPNMETKRVSCLVAVVACEVD